MAEDPRNSTKSKKSSGLGFAMVLAAIPVVLIAAAVFEEVVIGSHHLANLYRQIGLFEPLDWLLDNTVGRLL